MSKYQPYANSDQIVSYICLSTILMYILRSSHPAKIILFFFFYIFITIIIFFKCFPGRQRGPYIFNQFIYCNDAVFLELLIVVYL